MNYLKYIFTSNSLTDEEKGIKNCILGNISYTYKRTYLNSSFQRFNELTDKNLEKVILTDYGSFVLWMFKNFNKQLEEFLNNY